MENKQSKRRWKIPVLLVSAICILLASSFVFYTTAEASVLAFSLEGASFGNPVLDDGSLSSNGLDRALIDNYSVTAQNQYVGVTQENFSLTGNVYSTVSTYAVPVWDCSSAYAAYLTSSGGTDVRLYTANGVVNKTYSVSPKFFFSDRFLNGYSVYDLNGDLIGSFSLDSSRTIVACFLRDNKYIVFAQSVRYYIVIFDSNFNQLYIQETLSAGGSFYCTDEYAVRFSSSTIYIFDFESFVLSQLSNGTGNQYGYVTQIGDRLYRCYNKVFYVYDLELNYLFSYTASNLGAINNDGILNSFCGAFVIDNSSASYTIASIPNQYYANFSAHFVDSFTSSKWINFSCKPSSDGSVVGGDAVGIKLDYALSDQYLSTVNTYGVRFSGCTILASLDDLSTGTGYYGLPPLVVKVNGAVVPRITKEYESVEKVGDVYLYAFSAFCDFQGSTKINSLEIIMNCFVPEQLSRHSFSLPVSDVELYLEPAGGGGGGGEPSDTSSGGTSSGGGGGGGNETGAPSEMPPESIFFEDTLYVYKKLPDGGFGWVTDWNIKDYESISVFTGYAPSVALSGYIHSQLEQYIGTIRVRYQDGRTAYIETDGTGIVGYGSSENSMVYPFSLGGWVDVEISENNYLYIDQNTPENLLLVGSGQSNYLQLNMRSDADLFYVRANDTDTDLGWVSGNGETGELTVREKIWQLQKYGNASGLYDTQLLSAGQFFSFHRYDFPPASTDGAWNGLCYLNLYFYTGDKSPYEVSVEYSIYLEEQSRIAAEESYLNYLAGLAYGDMKFDADYSGGFQDAFDIQDGLYDAPAGAMIDGAWDALWDSHPFAFAMISAVIVFSIVKFIINKV